MDSETKKIISRLISNVAHHNKNLWWELKREIFDSGYQPIYHWQGEFTSTAVQELQRLSAFEQRSLIDDWQDQPPQIRRWGTAGSRSAAGHRQRPLPPVEASDERDR
jgi:hypothetical protein